MKFLRLFVLDFPIYLSPQLLTPLARRLAARSKTTYERSGPLVQIGNLGRE